MSGSERVRAALARRLRGPYLALGRLDARLADVQRRLGIIETATASSHGAAWGERRPLITVTVATRDRPELSAGESCSVIRCPQGVDIYSFAGECR